MAVLKTNEDFLENKGNAMQAQSGGHEGKKYQSEVAYLHRQILPEKAMFESVQLQKLTPGEAYSRLYKNGAVTDVDPTLQAMGLETLKKKQDSASKKEAAKPNHAHYFKSVTRDKRE